MLPTSPPWCIPGSLLSLLCTAATRAATEENAPATTRRGWERHSKATEALSLGKHLLPPYEAHKPVLQRNYGRTEL